MVEGIFYVEESDGKFLRENNPLPNFVDPITDGIASRRPMYSVV